MIPILIFKIPHICWCRNKFDADGEEMYVIEGKNDEEDDMNQMVGVATPQSKTKTKRTRTKEKISSKTQSANDIYIHMGK